MKPSVGVEKEVDGRWIAAIDPVGALAYGATKAEAIRKAKAIALEVLAEFSRHLTFLVALTGWGTEEDKKRSLEAGFDLHLTKPVDARLVEGLLQRARGR